MSCNKMPTLSIDICNRIDSKFSTDVNVVAQIKCSIARRQDFAVAGGTFTNRFEINDSAIK
jgi:hypothetical protein